MAEYNIIDELFQRINELSSEKEMLESNLKTLENDYENKEMFDLCSSNGIVEELEHIINDEKRNIVYQKNNNLKETEINYTPFDNFNEVFIAGDFTNWEKVLMNKKNNIFTYNTILLKGYKYYYCFYYQNELMINFDCEYQENPFKNMTNNYILIINDDESFDYLSDYSILENAIKESNKLIVDKSKDLENIQKVFNFSNYLKSCYDKLILEREEKIALSNYFFDQQLNKLSEIRKSYDLSFLKERVLLMDNFQFLIKNIVSDKILCVRLYDKNGIKININFHIENNFYETINTKDIFNNSYLYSVEETTRILEDYYNDKKNILKIYYELIGNNDTINNQKDLIPYKIIPDSVNINSYDLSINNNKIIEVRYRDTASIILFEAILIKEGSKYSGLISTSSLKVYTALYNKDIMNIIHIHLNDTSDEISVDSTFLQRGHSVTEEKFFNIDSMGKKLNYKFIFRDYKLMKIYYNLSNDFVDEPDYEEIRIKQDKIVKIKDHGLYSNYFAKVYNIPLGMIVRKEKDESDLIERLKSSEINREGYCPERHLEELPGFVDIEVLFTPDTIMLEECYKMSIPVCKLIPLSPKEELIFEKKMIKRQNRKKSLNMETLNNLYEQYFNLEKYIKDPELLNTLNLDDIKKMLDFVDQNITSDIKNNLEDTDSKNKNDYIEDVKFKLTPILHKHLRLMSLLGHK